MQKSEFSLYYFSALQKDKTSGVEKKIIAQIKGLKKIGIEIRACNLATNHKFNAYSQYRFIVELGKITNYFIFQIKGNIHFLRLIKKLSAKDIFYHRPFSLSIFHYIILVFFKKCYLIAEANSTPSEYSSVFIKFSETLFGKKIRRKYDALICVTEEIAHYYLNEKTIEKCIVITNGIDTESLPIRMAPPLREGYLHLLAVANVNYWHGVDRLLEGLAKYSGEINVIIHIAGGGNSLPDLVNLASILNVENSVIFHGYLTGIQLDELYNKCHIGIGSLGIHRIGLSEATTLKSREYCARGLPYIIAVRDPDFHDDFPYIKMFPPDESPINIEKIVEFAEIIYSDPHHTEKMRDYAIKNLDWSVKMQLLKTFIEEEVLSL